jgi:uncharacterized protein with HEPN domain
MKNDKLYLLHISECLDRIDRYVSEGAEQFMKDTKTQDAVLRNLQVMAVSMLLIYSNIIYLNRTNYCHQEVSYV